MWIATIFKKEHCYNVTHVFENNDVFFTFFTVTFIKKCQYIHVFEARSEFNLNSTVMFSDNIILLKIVFDKI